MTETGTPQGHTPLTEQGREIRIALVLYGGVSLAIYENGVTQAFYDLVKGKGVFGLMLAMLDATAAVDVIAGASAGGINGLMLATALSSGSDFDQTARLWRELGDIGALMRPVARSDNAQSLLDGEGYYHSNLRTALKKLLEDGKPDAECDGEMDIFIAATDLPGHVETFWDQIGNEIKDKNHRVVFHLKHRKGRKRLGLVDDENTGNTPEERSHIIDKQAEILASIARITSTFPAAFPPFRIEQIDEPMRPVVEKALEAFGGFTDPKKISHIYVDGGVLSNKPFKPVLRAIFYRMPYGLVDRRLFYVEPDPEHIGNPDPKKTQKLTTPLGTAVSCLTSIPSHQSIGDDLEQVRAHNARVKWLKEFKKTLTDQGLREKPEPASAQAAAYRRTRIDSLARSLLLGIEAVPCAGDYMVSEAHEQLHRAFTDYLVPVAETPEGMAIIDSCDIDYHMRRAFHMLYLIYDDYEKGGDNTEKTRLVMKSVSRIIKMLKLVRDMLYSLRDSIIPIIAGSGAADPSTILSHFQDFLSTGSDPWNLVNRSMEKAFSLESLADRDDGLLSSSLLSRIATKARESVQKRSALAPQAPGPTEKGPMASGDQAVPTILSLIGQVLRQVLQEWPGNNSCFDAFDALDTVFFPLEFACGIHELDEVELVRVSPKDAQTGLSKLPADQKVTGDELAHFSALFRKDWRSNDILWGRLDGICQIVSSFLDDKALARLVTRGAYLQSINIDSFNDMCPPYMTGKLDEAWKGFVNTVPVDPVTGKPTPEQKTAFATLKETLILAGQHDAAKNMLGDVYEDMYVQDFNWDRIKNTKLPENPSDPLIENEAKHFSETMLGRANGKTPGETFNAMAMGAQTITGKNGKVPLRVLLEYASQAFLLFWGMVENSLAEKKKWIPGRVNLRFYFRNPVLFLYYSLMMMKKEKRLFPLLFWSVCAASLAAGVTGAVLGHYGFLILAIVPFFLIGLYILLRSPGR